MSSDERTDLLETLQAHRRFLLHTVTGLSDEQARLRTTISELTLGGVVKHVAHTEQQWTRFIEMGPSVMEMTADAMAAHAQTFVLGEDETVQQVIDFYSKVAEETDDLVRTVPDLGVTQPLPSAPWFPPGAVRSARRVFMHIVAETAQHAGHADIIREALDGQRTMG